MPLGFYIAGVASQMAQYKLNDISHNLANINTTGYLASHASFSTQFSGQLAGGSAQTPAAFSVLALLMALKPIPVPGISNWIVMAHY